MTPKEQFLQKFRGSNEPQIICFFDSVEASIGQTKNGKWRIVYEDDSTDTLVVGSILEADTPEELAILLLMSMFPIYPPHHKGQYEHWQEREENEE